jgi:hypothetical protein
VKRRFAAVALATAVLVPTSASAVSAAYVDVPDDGTHAVNIDKIAAAGITAGYSDGTFRPDVSVTRAQMATFLVRALGLTPIDGTRFGDTAGDVHERSINAVAEAGITLGDQQGNFQPAQPVTRAQMATFLVRALDLPSGAPAAFSDIAGNTHADNIQRLVHATITTGYSDGTFRPNVAVSRAQMATFLSRALDLPAPPPPIDPDAYVAPMSVVPLDATCVGWSGLWAIKVRTVASGGTFVDLGSPQEAKRDVVRGTDVIFTFVYVISAPPGEPNPMPTSVDARYNESVAPIATVDDVSTWMNLSGSAGRLPVACTS